jgi:hypothetical protein
MLKYIYGDLTPQRIQELKLSCRNEVCYEDDNLLFTFMVFFFRLSEQMDWTMHLMLSPFRDSVIWSG